MSEDNLTNLINEKESTDINFSFRSVLQIFGLLSFLLVIYFNFIQDNSTNLQFNIKNVTNITKELTHWDLQLLHNDSAAIDIQRGYSLISIDLSIVNSSSQTVNYSDFDTNVEFGFAIDSSIVISVPKLINANGFKNFKSLIKETKKSRIIFNKLTFHPYESLDFRVFVKSQKQEDIVYRSIGKLINQRDIYVNFNPSKNFLLEYIKSQKYFYPIFTFLTLFLSLCINKFNGVRETKLSILAEVGYAFIYSFSFLVFMLGFGAKEITDNMSIFYLSLPALITWLVSIIYISWVKNRVNYFNKFESRLLKISNNLNKMGDQSRD